MYPLAGSPAFALIGRQPLKSPSGKRGSPQPVSRPSGPAGQNYKKSNRSRGHCRNKEWNVAHSQAPRPVCFRGTGIIQNSQSLPLPFPNFISLWSGPSKNHQIPVTSPYYLTTFRQNIKFNYFISIFRNSKCSADWIPSHRRPSAGYSQNLPLQFCIMLSFWLQNVNKLTMFTNRNHQFLCNQHRNWFEILWKSPLSFFENQLYAPPNL